MALKAEGRTDLYWTEAKADVGCLPIISTLLQALGLLAALCALALSFL